MKLSIAWIFDHLGVDWHSIDLAALVAKFNATTAEIERVELINFPFGQLYAGRVISSDPHKGIRLFIAEQDKELILPFRSDAYTDAYFLIGDDTNMIRWASTADFFCAKDQLLSSVQLAASEQGGFWKNRCETTDYILHIDNKSITNRPDLWGHRGFAREIGALLDIPLIQIDQLCASVPIHDKIKPSNTPFPVIADAAYCSRLALLSLHVAAHLASPPLLMSRLLRVDCKPINLCVDLTNYVMFDLGQPMHAFDASSLDQKKIEVRTAHAGETIRLLDSQLIHLHEDDIIIADTQRPLSLAGVMGGIDSGITPQSTHLLLEAGCFNAVAIRKTAARYKKRTEAAMRFEKSMDPEAPPFALQRFVALLDQLNVSYQLNSAIMTVGNPPQTIVIELSHDLIEKRLGVSLNTDFVIKTWCVLGCLVSYTDDENGCLYSVTIPSFRATKDLTLPIDLIEEIGRFYGYDALPVQLPLVKAMVRETRALHKERLIKNLLSYGACMKEIQNYAFFDEAFLQRCTFDPHHTVSVQQPVSENWRRLVTTLIPGLMHAVINNDADNNELRFFEWNRVWHYDGQELHEKNNVAGIFWSKKGTIDFYKAKSYLVQFFHNLNITTVQWRHCTHNSMPWYAMHQTAELIVADQKIGHAGMINPSFWHQIGKGEAFVFECNADVLKHLAQQDKKFSPLPIYPAVERDISMLISLSMTVQRIIDLVMSLDERMVSVHLIDYYDRPEWKDQRSVTIRLKIRDKKGTLTAPLIEEILAMVTTALIKQGAVIR